jgi:signal transduction histidine kinase
VTDAQRQALARIRESQRHLLGLVSEVLEHAQIEAGAVSYRLADVPVAELLATCEALTAPQAGARDVVVVNDGCDAALRVRADADKLRQVVLALLTNAIEFTAPGGRVAVACAAAGATLRVTVADTGCGIAPADLERVFEPFVRVGTSGGGAHEGVGLGLAISRDLARGMGGDLTVESAAGVGSTFTVTLPLAPPAS